MIELHFRLNKSFVRISTQRWARCTQRWAFCSPATGPARCPRPSRCFHRLPSLFIFKSCLFTWPRPAIRWRNPQFRNWEQLLYLTEPEKWSAAAMYQVIGYISQHLGLFCVTPCCDDLSRPELLMVLKCFKTGLISVLVIPCWCHQFSQLYKLSHRQATRIFTSNLKEKMAQRFFNLILLPR